MLEQVLQLDPDPERMPVAADLLTSVRDVLAEAGQGGYDVDEVIFHAVIAVHNLETELMSAKADTIGLRSELLELRTALLEQGISDQPRDAHH